MHLVCDVCGGQKFYREMSLTIHVNAAGKVEYDVVHLDNNPYCCESCHIPARDATVVLPNQYEAIKLMGGDT